LIFDLIQNHYESDESLIIDPKYPIPYSVSIKQESMIMTLKWLNKLNNYWSAAYDLLFRMTVVMFSLWTSMRRKVS